MIDWVGRWTAEKDYNEFPIEKWCDMDYIANYIKEQNYTIETDIENLSYMISSYYDTEIEDKTLEYTPAYNDNLMIDMLILKSIMEDSGGLSEFDYY